MPEDEHERSERWYTSAEVAQILELSVPTVLHYSREIREQLSIRQEGRRLLFSPSDVEAIRMHHERPRTRGMTAKEIATNLNIPQHRLRGILDSLKPLLPRVEPMRKGLYAPEAIEIIRKQVKRTELKGQWTGEAAEYWRGLAVVRAAALRLGQLSRDLSRTYERLRQNPPSVTAFIHTLPDHDLELIHPLGVTVSPLRKSSWRASLLEAGLHGKGRSVEEAVLSLRSEIVLVYRSEEVAPEAKGVLQKLVRRISS